MRTHRALQKLGTQLAKAGVHTFRFDYFGTGDSAGGAEAGTPSRWIDDVVAAAAELQETAGVKRLTLVGLRTGALFAAAAARRIGTVERLVFWDPVVSGARHVDEQLAQSTPGPDAGTVGVHGFPLPAAVQQELRALDLGRMLGPDLAANTLLVVSNEEPQYDALMAAAVASGVRMSKSHIPSAGTWDDLDRLGAALLPLQIIRGIVAWVAGEDVA